METSLGGAEGRGYLSKVLFEGEDGVFFAKAAMVREAVA
jgi:hypothetical protein